MNYKIIQISPSLLFGDAVSNHIIAIDTIFKNNRFNSFIFTDNIDSRVKNKIKILNSLDNINNNDIIIYHMSIGSYLAEKIGKIKCKKIMIYHNITPSIFFKLYNNELAKVTQLGRENLEYLKDKINYCLADSEYNRDELLELGYKKVDVLPIILPFKDYEKSYCRIIEEKFHDDITNIIFIGRFAPNKKQEDIINSFYYYKKYINKKSRLILIGSYKGLEKYYENLKKLTNELKLDDVHFTGHIKFEELLAYYKVADVFLCMSEHEGFCVPLVESMFFEVPIIAYNSTAIPFTLGNSGILINKKDYILIAETLNYIIENNDFRKEIINSQKQRLKDFNNEIIEKKFLQYFEKFLKEAGNFRNNN